MIERFIANIGDSRFDRHTDRIIFLGGIAMLALALIGVVARLG